MSKIIKYPGYNLTMINTNKFSTFNIVVRFTNYIDNKRALSRTILFDMLSYSNKIYKTKKKVSLREEELYSITYGTSTYTYGNIIQSNMAISNINPEYIEDESYLEDCIKHLFDFINNPNLTQEILDIYKARFISDIKSRKEVPFRELTRKALKLAVGNTNTNINIEGNTIKEIKDITLKDIKNEYKNIMENDEIVIHYAGKIKFDIIDKLINKYALFTKRKKKVNYDIYVDNKSRNKIIKRKDTTKFSQSHIKLIYNINDLTDFEKKYVVNLYEDILGGGGLESKLSKNLREDKSLCYSVSANYMRHDNLLEITTSVSRKNIDIAIDAILDTVNNMNNITQESDLKRVRDGILSSLNLNQDNISYLAYHQRMEEFNFFDPMDEKINNYKKVTLKDINKINEKLKLNTIYIMEGVGENEKN